MKDISCGGSSTIGMASTQLDQLTKKYTLLLLVLFHVCLEIYGEDRCPRIGKASEVYGFNLFLPKGQRNTWTVCEVVQSYGKDLDCDWLWLKRSFIGGGKTEYIKSFTVIHIKVFTKMVSVPPIMGLFILKKKKEEKYDIHSFA